MPVRSISPLPPSHKHLQAAQESGGASPSATKKCKRTSSVPARPSPPQVSAVPPPLDSNKLSAEPCDWCVAKDFDCVAHPTRDLCHRCAGESSKPKRKAALKTAAAAKAPAAAAAAKAPAATATAPKAPAAAAAGPAAAPAKAAAPQQVKNNFQILLGINDEDNIMWTVLNRALEGSAELSAEETALVCHTYSVWPKSVNMSNEMRKMFLNVLLG
ncbi:hypothetical protein AURDEDRAFT_163532 [Auricularia subglabra TFB-10046 SS5]|nr:hypothetical protein AURDEDRAFT_163532 [Auricularia subglabra TFB-10046 SS5]